jgi:hypothetical protein
MAYRNREEEKLERREEQARREDGPRPAGGAGADRGKKTFAERDKARRGGGAQDRDERPRGAKGESASYRNYKSKLDRLFEGELKLPKATVVEVIRKDEPVKSAAPASVQVTRAAMAVVEVVETSPKDRLKAAEDPDAIESAARACLQAGGLPNDADALAKVLLLKDEALLTSALEAVLDLMERGRPKNAKVITARIAERQALLTDPHAIDLAAGIRARLGS